MKTRLLIFAIIGISAIIILPNFSLVEMDSMILWCNHWVFSDSKTCKPLWIESEPESSQGVCGPGDVIQEDGYCYKDGMRIEFGNPEFEIDVETSVRQEIYDLLSDKDVEYYSINLDPKTGIIEIAVSDNSYDSQIKEIISKYTNDIEFNITYANYTDAIIIDDFQHD